MRTPKVLFLASIIFTIFLMFHFAAAQVIPSKARGTPSSCPTIFEPGSAGAGGELGGLLSGVIGGILGGIKTLHVAMIVKVIDATTIEFLLRSKSCRKCSGAQLVCRGGMEN